MSLEKVNAHAQLIAAMGVIASLFISPLRFGKTAARPALREMVLQPLNATA